ncbi:MAG: hypothetical protein EAZ91_17685 [Cytophagales bacterium]|nr:MAG: hypothetical protein EAZ91_17685 [Cytophagales bacterium]
MKTVSSFIIGFVVLLNSCSKDPTEPAQSAQPTPIGQGVEIYRARLDWEKNDRGRNIRVKGASLLSTTPLVRYDEITTYYRSKTAPSIHCLFDLTKPVSGPKGESPIFGYPTLLHATASDTGLCVTVDRQVIFAGIWGQIATLHYSDLIFRTAYETNRQNSIVVAWDSVYSIQGQEVRQTGPDPRFNTRLLDRLRRDGKLKL